MSRPAGKPEATHPRLVLLAILLLAAHAWILRAFTVDDAFITFRYARNIAAGLGPVFNRGERVEGFSNPLYTFLLAGFTLLTRRPEWIPEAGRALGVLCAAFTLVLLAGLPGIAWKPGPVLASFMTATSVSFALWSVGGLETPVYGFLVIAAFAATLARPRSSGGQLGTGLLLALVTLSRPEGGLIALILFLWRFLDPETSGDGAGHRNVMVAAVIPVAAYLGFRLAYYHDWLPNTYYAKNGPVGRSWQRGLWYLVSFIHGNGGKWLYAAAPLAFFAGDTRRPAILASLVLLAQAGFILMTGGDWMDHHRFIAPFVPLVYLVTALGWANLARFLVAPLRKWPGGAFPGFLEFVGLALVWVALLLPTIPMSRAEETEAYVNASPYYDTVGKVVGVMAPEGWRVATHDIGAIGWYGKSRVLDLLGLVDPELAHNRVTADESVAKKDPDIVILHYDNRKDPTGRWRMIDAPDFAARYAVPASPVPLPGSVMVRKDRLPEVQARLAGMSKELRDDVTSLNGWLQHRQPDGHPWTGGSP